MEDEMKITLRTKFTRTLVAKLLTKVIRKKLGYDAKIRFDELDARFVDGETTLKMDVELKLNSDDCKELIKLIFKDEED